MDCHSNVWQAVSQTGLSPPPSMPHITMPCCEHGVHELTYPRMADCFINRPTCCALPPSRPRCRGCDLEKRSPSSPIPRQHEPTQQTQPGISPWHQSNRDEVRQKAEAVRNGRSRQRYSCNLPRAVGAKRPRCCLRSLASTGGGGQVNKVDAAG